MSVSIENSFSLPFIQEYLDRTPESLSRLAIPLKDTEKRMQFAEWLIEHFNPATATRVDFKWHSKVITLLCMNVAPSKPGTKTQEYEDRLFATLIECASPHSKNILDDASETELDADLIFKSIKDTPLPETNRALLPRLSAKKDIPGILFQSIHQNNMAMLHIIQQEEPANFAAYLKTKDEEGNTPIAGAAIVNNLEMIQFLQSASPEAFKEALVTENINHNTPALLAAHHNVEMTKLMLEAAPSEFERINKEGLGLLDILKGARPKNYQTITRTLDKTSLLRKIHKERFNRVALAHAWHLEGTTLLIEAKTQKILLRTNLEGHFIIQWYHLIAKDLERFQQAYPSLLSMQELTLLEEVLIPNTTSDFPPPEAQLQKIKSRLPVLITTGSSSHDVILLVWGTKFLICNRGKKSVRPIQIYSFNPEKITVNDLQDIRETCRKPTKDYFKLFFQQLPKRLEFEQSTLDETLEKNISERFQSQIVGNCSFVSLTTAIYGLNLLRYVYGCNSEGVLLPERKLEKLHAKCLEALQKADVWQQTWLTYQQFLILDRAICPFLNKTSYFAADDDLFRKTFCRAHNLPLDDICLQWLQSLYQNYLSLHNEDTQALLEKEMAFWKSMPKHPLL